MSLREHTDLPTRKLNRLSARSPRSDGLFWCGRCDAAKVGVGERCRHCRHRHGTRTIKHTEIA